MIITDPLKHHPQAIPTLARMWREVLGKCWAPDYSVPEIESWYREWLNNDVPLAHVALDHDVPVEACSLQWNDGIRPDLAPWLGDLVVAPSYQHQGIGTMLIDITKHRAHALGFSTLYLFTFDPTLPEYYIQRGWRMRGMDQYAGHPVTVMETAL